MNLPEKEKFGLRRKNNAISVELARGLGLMVWIAQANDPKHRYVEQAKDTDRLEPKGK
ncbi:hypothetical protein [Wolbachia endosymbiont (group A) of Acrocera orbiculus]|uniref:hypothetical protein n=1 Tax=Wolbachia endosymbiont (group A) of Acrocera orbiculus TaxID=2953971 RepID=UPI0022279E20|nr:hypothetical protein [Wolbachia endosymbiont (group A) of Acrocera orbiculus]